MKRITVLLLVVLLAIPLVACGKSETLFSTIVLSEESFVLKEGESVTVTAKALPENSTEVLIWTSSNEEIATVENGIITGIKAGTAKIIASGNKSGVNAICNVVVESPAAYDLLSESDKRFVDAFLKYAVPVFVQPETIEIKNIHYNSHDTMGVYWEVQMNVANGYGGVSGNIYLLLEQAFKGEHLLKNGQEPYSWSSGYDIDLINRAIQEKTK